MRVGRYHHAHAALFGHAQVGVFQIEAIGRRVALHGHSAAACGIQDALHVVGHGVTPQQDAPGGMPDDLHVGILDGRKHTLGDGGAVEIHEGVNRRDHDIEFGEDLVRQIEAAIFEDIDLDTREDANAIHLGSANFPHVLARARFVHAIGDGHGFAVIGDGDVFVSHLARGPRHLLDGMPAVAGGSVHLQIAVEIALLDEPGQAMLFGGFDLAAIFAQLRRNEVELEFRVDLFLAGAGDAALLLQRGQGVFVQRVTHLDGAAAQ